MFWMSDRQFGSNPNIGLCPDCPLLARNRTSWNAAHLALSIKEISIGSGLGIAMPEDGPSAERKTMKSPGAIGLLVICLIFTLEVDAGSSQTNVPSKKFEV